MKIFRAAQVRDIDRYTIEQEPIASIDLMERAASRLCTWYVKRYHIDRRVIIFAGPGNNGGDGLALARQLARRQYRVKCILLDFGKRSADCQENLERLDRQGLVDLQVLGEKDPLPELGWNDVVFDGIFGSGLSRPADGFPSRVIQHINAKASRVIAIDIPSGLMGEENPHAGKAAIIRAHCTLSFQFPFLSFFFPENEVYVGRWHLLNIRLHPEIITKTPCLYQTMEADEVRKALPKRGRFSHKGSHGHALLIAGSYGMMGAALLAGKACLRTGTGLVSLHVPRSGYQIVQTAFPEALVSLDQSDILFSEAPDLAPYSALGIGPGLGCKPNTAKGLRALLKKVTQPLLMDADALNLLAGDPALLELLPSGTVLTPHPREFDRLAGPSSTAYERHLKQGEFARRYQVIVVLKGAHTAIAHPDGAYYLNTTGNPGMATGGSGDVLSGMITALLAQGVKPLEAALAGVYLHGLAGDLAAEDQSQEALIAGDLTKHIGAAFRKIFLHSRS